MPVRITIDNAEQYKKGKWLLRHYQTFDSPLIFVRNTSGALYALTYPFHIVFQAKYFTWYYQLFINMSYLYQSHRWYFIICLFPNYKILKFISQFSIDILSI